MRRRTRTKSRKTKGGACSCAAASPLPIALGGVRRHKSRINNNRRKTQKRVRFA